MHANSSYQPGAEALVLIQYGVQVKALLHAKF